MKIEEQMLQFILVIHILIDSFIVFFFIKKKKKIFFCTAQIDFISGMIMKLMLYICNDMTLLKHDEKGKIIIEIFCVVSLFILFYIFFLKIITQKKFQTFFLSSLFQQLHLLKTLEYFFFSLFLARIE